MTTNNKDILNASNSNILYEASDLERGIGLILFEKDGKRFQLHVWKEDDLDGLGGVEDMEEYYKRSVIMDLDKQDLKRLVKDVYSNGLDEDEF
jgi:hypothetical protein